MSITTTQPGLLVRDNTVHVGCRCKACGEVTWLRIATSRAVVPRERKWRCSTCGEHGKLSTNKQG